MTKKLLLSAGALAALAFAGAAQAQSITNVTISGQSRNLVAAPAVSDPVYRVALESVSSATTRSTTEATSVTATYGGAGLPVQAAAETVRYRVAFGLSGSATPTYAASLTPLSLTVAASGLVGGCAVDTPIIVAGGARGDSSVTYEFGFTGACTAGNVTGVTLVHPFEVASFGSVALTTSTSSVGSTAKAVPANITGISNSLTIVSAVAGYEFVATDSQALAFGSRDVFDLTQNPQGNRFTTISGDGLGNIGFRRVAYTGGNAFVGLRGAVLPQEEYTVQVRSLNSTFGTNFTSGFNAGLGTVASDTSVAAITTSYSAPTAANAAVTQFTAVTGTRRVIVQKLHTGTASLSARDQAFEAVLVPAVNAASANLVTLPGARTYALQTIYLDGTPVVAPWMTSTSVGANTVLRISNNGTRAVEGVILDLRSAQTATATSAATCTSAQAPTLATIPAGGELVVNSALLTTCFGEFGRGDVHVRVLDNNADLTAKLRVVTAGGIVTEQSLGRASGSGLVQPAVGSTTQQ